VFADSLRTLNPLGSILALGFAGGPWEDVSPQLLVGRNVSVHGFYLGRLTQLRPQVVREATAELVELWRQGAVRPLVGAELPLDRANDALDLIESRRSVGKVVLVP
jgi:NADPH2:quinone reductase